MISFLRRKLSTWVALGLFGIILIAFVVTGVSLPDGSGVGSLGGNADAPARVGGQDVSGQDVLQRTQAQYDAARRQDPDLTLSAFVRSGAVDQTVEQILNVRALESFANDEGMFVSRRLVDAEIANIAAFRGPTGQFDRNAFLAILAQQKLSEILVRQDIARDKLATMIAVPLSAGVRVPATLASPFAAAQLEQRSGLVIAVPNSAVPSGKSATDAEILAYYKQNPSLYTAPESRIIRYARFDRSRFAKLAVPSEAEIAKAYKDRSAQYAGKETRILTQVIVPDLATAAVIAARINTGTSIEAAAKAAGSEATTLSAQDKAAFSGLSSTAVAQAAFATAQGAVSAPNKSGLGWHVVRVDKIVKTSAKPLSDVRAELSAELAKGKTDGLVADFVTKIEDSIAGGATLDDVVKAEALVVEASPAIDVGGAAVVGDYKLPAEFAQVLRDAFQAVLDDDPAVIALPGNDAYVLYDLDRITPAAPRPLAEVRSKVASDIENNRASAAARAIANAIQAKLSKGVAAAEAIRGAGISLPAPKSISVRRLELSLEQGRVPATTEALFALRKQQARLVEDSDKRGWSVVYLSDIKRPETAEQAGLVQVQQRQMARAIGEEYSIQFTRAVRAMVGARANPAAIGKLKRDLGGATGQ